MRAEGRSFDDTLKQVEWVVVTNFERGQPAYLARQIAHLRRVDFEYGITRAFRDPRYWTIVVPSEALLARRPLAVPPDPIPAAAGRPPL